MTSNLKVNNILPSTGTTVAVSGIASVTSSVSIASSCTATTFYGSGANLTSLPSQLTLSNNADNRIITGGSGVNLNGEANLTFTGSALNVVGTIDADDVVSIDGSSNVDLRIQTGANNRLVIRGASSLSNIITQNNNNLSFRHDGGTGGGSEIFLMNSNGIDVGNNKRIQIKDYYGDVSARLENSDSTNNSFRIDVDPDASGASSAFLVRIDGNEKIRVLDGGGITFNGDSSTSNALDDYEEGTFTPTQPTTGFNSASGNYTKIGRYVYANIFCTLPTNTSGVAFYIDSLPFTALNNSGTNIHGGYAIYSTYGNPITVRVHDNATRAQVSAIGGGNITLNPLDNINFRLQVHYMTN